MTVGRLLANYMYQPTVGRRLVQAVGQLSVNSQGAFGGLFAYSFFHYSGNHLSKMMLESENNKLMAMICKHIVGSKLVKTTIKRSSNFGTGPLCTQCFSCKTLTLLACITSCIINFSVFIMFLLQLLKEILSSSWKNVCSRLHGKVTHLS